MKRLALILLALAPACSSDRLIRPSGGELRSRSGVGVVLFDDPSLFGDAARAAQAVDAHYDGVADRLGVHREGPLEVWLDPSWHVRATTFSECVVFNPTGTSDCADLFLAHEIAHWHLHDTVLRQHLPLLLEEGICEWIAVNRVDRWEGDRRALYRSRLVAVRDRGEWDALVSKVSLDSSEWSQLSYEERLDLYALGFSIVDRVGIDSVLEFARHADISPSTLASWSDARHLTERSVAARR